MPTKLEVCLSALIVIVILLYPISSVAFRYDTGIVAEIKIQDSDEDNVPQIPDTPNPGNLSLVAGGSEIGIGKPALTAFIGGVFPPRLEVDKQGRIYYSQDDTILRVDGDGTLEMFLKLSSDPSRIDENLIWDISLSGDYLYLLKYDFINSALSILRSNIATGNIEWYEEAFQPGPLAVDSSGNVFVGNPPGFEGVVNGMAVDPADDSLIIASSTDSDFGSVPQVFRFDTGTGEQSALIVDDTSEMESISSVAVLPSGKILLVGNSEHRIYLLDPITGTLKLSAGNGYDGDDGDGWWAPSASLKASDLAVDQQGNFYFISDRLFDSTPPRIRMVEVKQNTISTVVGLPGFLTCASTTNSQLTGTSSIDIDSNGIIVTQSNDAILAIDPGLDSIYTLGGIYGTRGGSDDGVIAFGNPLQPWSGEDWDIGALYIEDGVTLAPNGDIFVSEAFLMRRIDRASGTLSSVTAGQYSFMQHDGNRFIYAWSGGDFVKVNTINGDVTTFIQGGYEIPVVGESAQGRDFHAVSSSPAISNGDVSGSLNDAVWDSEGNIFVSINNTLAPDFASGIYRIDAQTGILTSIVSVPPGSTHSILGELVLDEAQGVIYYSNLLVGEDFAGNGLLIPVIKVDITSGKQTRIAGIDSRKGIYKYSSNPLQAELYIRDMTLSADGDLYLVAGGEWWGRPDVVLKISQDALNQGSLIPSDVKQGSNVGESVASTGNWQAIGVPNNKLSNGDTGEVLLYQDNDCRPILQDRIRTPAGAHATQFGSTVAFVGDSLVIGSREDQLSTSKMQSDQIQSSHNDPLFKLGVFGLKKGSGTHWQMVKDLSASLPPDTEISSLTSDGDSFAVGSPKANGGKGEVTVFDINDVGNPMTVRSTAPGATNFGKSLAMEGNKMAAGADLSVGIAEVFQKSGSGYVSVDVVQSTRGNTGFARSLAMNDEDLYVGAPHSTGGKVFNYTIANGNMDLSDTLSDPQNPGNASFGTALAIEEGVLVVGAPDTQVASVQSQNPSIENTGEIHKTQTDLNSGAIFAFGVKDKARNRINGVLLFSRLARAAEGYGASVAIDKGRIVVGAPETDDGRGTFESVGGIVDAAELSGLWYDPAQDGEGFNVLVADAGMVVFFYGYTRDGERLWLISDTITGDFGFGEDIHIPVYKAVEGEFTSPVSSRDALVKYGLLSMSFGSLRSATFTINGFDGNKISRSSFLADTGANAAAYSGLWYDQSKDGEGFNVISGQSGTVIFYYGSSKDGERLWLISDLLSNDIEDGAPVTGTIYQATGGDFLHPRPSAQALKEWGSIEVRFDDCNDGRFILSGSDGNKTSDVIKLAGVGGAVCN